jgi:hypothetical protein
MEVVLGDGQVPPVWAPDLGNGHGQPLFEFSPPLVYVAAMPFRLLGLGLADSLQLALAALHFAGAVAVYRLGRRLRFERGPAVAAAGLWLFIPYLSLDLFVRTAFAEAAAVACAPIALLGVLRAADAPSTSRMALGGGAVALVVLSHNAAALLLMPALALTVIATAMTAPAGRRVRSLGAGAGAIVIGLAMSAFFWLPAMAERDLVKTDLLRQDFLDWRLHSVYPSQLVWSRWGFGLSGPGKDDGMSFMVGGGHLALAAAGVVVLWRAAGGSQRRRRTGLTREASLSVAFALAAAAGMWLATTASAPLWSRIELLQYFAYPWRALLLPALFLPLLALPALAAASSRRWALPVLLLAVVAINLRHTEPKGYLKYDEEFYAPDSIARRGLNTTTREEFEPRWVIQRPPFEESRLRALNGALETSSLERRSHREEYRVVAAAATAVETAAFFYPGWTVLVDGEPTPVTPVPVRGTMAFELPAGEHHVVLELRPTAVRRWSSYVSAVAVLLCAAVPSTLTIHASRSRGHAGAALPPPAL